MKRFSLLLAGVALASSLQAEPFQQAEVTRVVNIVSLLKPDQAAKPASVGNVVNGKTAVQTGANSRTELEFPDKTVTRLGANALFRFTAGGREMDLERGTMLFSSPKGAGGGEVQAGAVTASVAGTNFLLAYVPGKVYKLIVLEGKVLVWLSAFPRQRQQLKAGQMLDFNPNSGKLAPLKSVNLKQLVSSSRLLEGGGFNPLPGKAPSLIVLAADRQQTRIVAPKPPATIGRERQVAQQTRNTTQQSQPPQAPASRPGPAPRPTPPPLPQATPKKPNPGPPPPHTGGGGTGGTIGSGGGGS